MPGEGALERLACRGEGDGGERVGACVTSAGQHFDDGAEPEQFLKGSLMLGCGENPHWIVRFTSPPVLVFYREGGLKFRRQRCRES